MPEHMVFGYVRVSTENQLENYSIDEQTERISSYCRAKGWTLLHTYIDGGFSGGNTDRPSLQEMLEAIRNGDADAVVVYKLDRLSRSQKDTLTLIEDEFLSNKTDFVSINENFDTSSPFGRAMIGILSVFAQLEKDQITERFTMGRIGRGKAGYFHGGGNAPTGYDYIDGKLILNHEEAIIRQIFSMFSNGATINSIFLRMQAMYGGSWSAAKVSNILKNSLYIGKVKFGGKEYQGVHEPILTKEEFDAVQRLLEKREAPLKQPFRAEYLLSGLAYCTNCGARYSANHGYYKCYSRAKSCKRFIIDPDCKNENWKIEDLDNQVVWAVKKLCADEKAMAAMGKKALRTAPKETREDLLKKKIAALDKQLEKLVELYQFSDIPLETLSERVKAIRTERQGLEERLSEKLHALPPIKERAQSFANRFDSAELDNKRILISSMVERVNIAGNSIEVVFRF